MTGGSSIDFPAIAGEVTRALLGEPNTALSSAAELRFGSRGSLSIDLERAIWHDHESGAGGGLLDLIARQTGHEDGAAFEWLREHGFAPERVPSTGERRKIVATYPYRDEEGRLLFEVVRFAPKDFRQRRPDPSSRDGWAWKLGDVRRVLYRLPELLEAPEGAVVLVVEGEADADRLASRGLIATTSPQGAGKWRDDYAEALRYSRVVVIPDNDEPGQRHGAAVVASCRKRGLPAAVLRLDGLPPKGDVSDWLAAGGTPDRLLALAEAALEAPQEEPAPDAPLLTFAPASALAKRPIPSREWHVEGLIPARTVTLLSGDGGTGKSLLALQLAVSTAAGLPWIGRGATPGRVLFLSAEDDVDELHRRLADILDAEGAGFDRLGNLLIRSLAGEDALLAVQDRRTGALAPTPLLDALDAEIARVQPALVVLDTLADLTAGEENNRAHARQFIGLLRGLAIRHGCALLLLSHPSLTGMASGSGLSGSTAWNASVRSRLYLDRIRDGDYEANPDARRLVTKKANFARTGGEIGLTWHAGVFVAEAAPTGLDALAAGAKGQRVFLQMLAEFTAQGRYVSANPGPTYAPAQFVGNPGAEGCAKRALKSAMDALFSRGDIVVAEHGKGAKARSHIAKKGAENAPI